MGGGVSATTTLEGHAADGIGGGLLPPVLGHVVVDGALVVDAAEHGAGVRVDEEQVAIEPQAVVRIPGAIHAESVELSVADALDEDRPDAVIAPGHAHVLLREAAIAFYQGEVDGGGLGSPDPEMGAVVCDFGSQPLRLGLRRRVSREILVHNLGVARPRARCSVTSTQLWHCFGKFASYCLPRHPHAIPCMKESSLCTFVPPVRRPLGSLDRSWLPRPYT